MLLFLLLPAPPLALTGFHPTSVLPLLLSNGDDTGSIALMPRLHMVVDLILGDHAGFTWRAQMAIIEGARAIFPDVDLAGWLCLPLWHPQLAQGRRRRRGSKLVRNIF